MTDTKKNDFMKTNDALAELSAAIVSLNSTFTAKKSELNKQSKLNSKELSDKQQRLDTLKESSSNVIGNIDLVIGKLNKVLENNGSDNNNN